MAGACCALLPIPRLLRAAPRERLTKPIPGSGEQLPLIGMGTWITFNVGKDPQAISERAEVLRAFFAAGGGMIDSSPLCGSAEAVVGETLARLGGPPGLLAATKVWTGSGPDGPREIAESQRLWGVERFDLLQVHNLLAWREHLATLRAMKADIGCTGWPQVLLKFIVTQPAGTCAIPATSQVAHMQENMAAGVGPLPDSVMRRRMAADFAAL